MLGDRYVIILILLEREELIQVIEYRIAIMVRGQLRCLGTSLELKQRFGSGYKISVCFEPDGQNRKNELIELLRKSMRPRQRTCR